MQRRLLVDDIWSLESMNSDFSGVELFIDETERKSNSLMKVVSRSRVDNV
jgi:hypothetical protein